MKRMKKMKKMCKALCVALGVTMLAAPVTVFAEEMTRENTMIYGAEFMVEQFNPILSSDYCNEMVFRGLMKTDVNCQPQCDIASSYEISDDLLTYTFNIRDNVKFHDGTTLTADDVVFTLNSILDEKVNSSIRSDFLQVDKVEKISDTCVSITLKEPFPPLLDKLTVGIVPAHCFEGQDVNTAEFNINPVGCGPYKFVSLEAGTKCVLTKFDDFYGDTAKIENIIYLYLPDYNTRALQLKNGEIDFTFIEPSQVEEIEKGENTQVFPIESADYRCVMYNFDSCEFFEDVNVRKALNCATDSQGVVNAIAHGYGQVAYSPLQKNKFNFEDVEKYEYDVERAAALLEESGWTDTDGDGFLDKDGEKLAFTLTAPIDDEVRVNIATYLSSEWGKLGVECTVSALGWDAIDISKCEAFLLGWGSPFDADNDTYRLFMTGSPDNYGFYSNADVDKALADARIKTEDDDRAACYADFQKAMSEDPAYNFICYLDALFAGSTRVSGPTDKVLGHHGKGIFWNIEEWELAE
ncbi:MAG: ABC transporter substrate-binding protein [Blautia sp.]|nr:ABC transporter substrate-binding protein [Blautia sp.]